MFGGRYLRPPARTGSMSTERDDHHDADPVTDRVHDNSWSANLEGSEHAESREYLVAQALSVDGDVVALPGLGWGSMWLRDLVRASPVGVPPASVELLLLIGGAVLFWRGW